MSILHTSLLIHLPNIIKDGYLLPKSPDNENTVKCIYGVYIFKEMEYNGKYWYYGSNVPNTQSIIFVINPKALKELKYIVCPGISYGYCLHHPESIIITNIKKYYHDKHKQNIATLETYINKELKTRIAEKQNKHTGTIKRDIGGMWDVLTHEVIFLEPIPLHYIDSIIVAPSMVKKVNEYIEKVNAKNKHKNKELKFKIIRRPLETQWKTVLFN